MSKHPDWLIRHLETAGHMVDGVTRAVTARACRTCGARVLAGLLHHGPAAYVHPDPLTAVGEALAVLSGRLTYSLWDAGAGRYELETRDSFGIAAHPAGTTTKFDVLVEHTCGTAPLPTGCHAPTVHQPKAAARQGAVAPF